MDDSRSNSNDFDAQIFEAAVYERFEAQIATLPEDVRKAFAEDCEAFRVRIDVQDEGDFATYFLKAPSLLEPLRVTVKAPSPQPPE